MSTTQVLISGPPMELGRLQSQVPEGDFGAELPLETRRLARQQLREDEHSRQQALQQFRDWASKSEEVQNCRLDANFMLRFLRVKKFSVPMAQQTLLKYLSLRQTLPHLCKRLDYLEPSVNELMSAGYIFPLLERDSEGRKVIFYAASKLDPYKFTCADMTKAHIMTYEALLEDETNQVHGFCHVSDLAGIAAAHVTLWSPSEFTTAVKWGEQSIPMRHKEMHFLNLPAPVRLVYDLARSTFSEKIRKRFKVHSNLKELHSKVDAKILPKEYGGKVPMQEMIDAWMRELKGKRERLMALDKMSLTCVYKPQRNRKSGDSSLKSSINSLPGSFRRLEVD
ncbi:clavesin-2 [Cloeon dipterum]|uniref:clavesin-2 n=1 Tax=Cloeon dipterum TaxID=197152 RepID=UPI003220126C